MLGGFIIINTKDMDCIRKGLSWFWTREHGEGETGVENGIVGSYEVAEPFEVTIYHLETAIDSLHAAVVSSNYYKY